MLMLFNRCFSELHLSTPPHFHTYYISFSFIIYHVLTHMISRRLIPMRIYADIIRSTHYIMFFLFVLVLSVVIFKFLSKNKSTLDVVYSPMIKIIIKSITNNKFSILSSLFYLYMKTFLYCFMLSNYKQSLIRSKNIIR